MIRIKVYYLDTPAENEKDLLKKDSFLIQKKSLLKGGFRAYLLERPEDFKQKDWFKRYQDRETIDFFIEGSGVYKLVNLDLIEGELYFEKSETPVYSKKCIFMDIPFDDEFKDGIFIKLKNKFSKHIKIDKIDGYTQGKGAIKLDDEILKAIRYSLLFIADITPLSNHNDISNKEKWLANSNVMLELGYALAVKDNKKIIITYNKDRCKSSLHFPFDIQSYFNQPYSLKQNGGFEALFEEISGILQRLGI